MRSRRAPLLAVERLVSGGQTGVDQGALDAAIALGIPHGGWCPRGRRSEAGPIAASYQLRECDSPAYSERTERNVVDSDGTLIVTCGPPQGGTALTQRLAAAHGKPCLVIDVCQGEVDLDSIRSWLAEHAIRVLNVAGPRESNWPGAHDAAYSLIRALADLGRGHWSLGDS